MKVITVINDQNHAGFNLLRLSCAINKLELGVLLYEDTFSSNRIKDRLLKEYLAKNIQDEEIIFFTDGNDTLLLCSEEEMMQKFKKMGKELVFSAEMGCWPDKSLAEKYPLASTAFRYLNSGGFIGKAGAVRRYLEDDLIFDSDFQHSNQYLWAKRFLLHPGHIGLDTACEIFQTFCMEEEDLAGQMKGDRAFDYSRGLQRWFDANFQIRNGRLYNKALGTWPCQAHFNGRSKSLIGFEIIDMLISSVPGSRPASFLRQ